MRYSVMDRPPFDNGEFQDSVADSKLTEPFKKRGADGTEAARGVARTTTGEPGPAELTAETRKRCSMPPVSEPSVALRSDTGLLRTTL